MQCLPRGGGRTCRIRSYSLFTPSAPSIHLSTQSHRSYPACAAYSAEWRSVRRNSGFVAPASVRIV